MRVLPSGSFECQNVLADYLPVFCCWLSPVFSDRTPGITKSFFISIAVLRNNCRDPLRARHRQAKAHRRAVVEHIKRVALELESICEGEHRRGECIE